MQKIEIMTAALKDSLSKLPAFSAVAKLSSVSRAAPTVHLSQSALSHLISNLESTLGVKLFKRMSHGLELTKEGKVLFDFSTRLFLDVETLAARLVSPDADATIMNVKVGTHETLAAHVWPKIIAGMTNEDTKLKISLLCGRVDDLIQLLMRGDVHATATVEPKMDSRLRITPVYQGKLQFFVGREFLQKKSRIHIKDVKSVPIFTDSQAQVREGLPITHALHQLGLDNSGRFEVSSFEAAISLAEMNLGIAVIPDRNASRAVSEGRIRPLTIQGLSIRDLLDYKICLTTCHANAQPSVHEILLKSFKT